MIKKRETEITYLLLHLLSNFFTQREERLKKKIYIYMKVVHSTQIFRRFEEEKKFASPRYTGIL